MSRAMLILVLCAAGNMSACLASEELVGTRPPEWELGDWINSPALNLKDLAGKVVLVRWWTAPTCPFCKATAPALNEFYEKYHERGLEVIGAYHHKVQTPLKPGDIKGFADNYGFKFPVAIDFGWKTLKRWWLDSEKRAATSVTFLIDRKGVIRFIHPGPQYIKGDKDYENLDAKIRELLAE